MNRIFTIAPMMDWTDRHCRAFHRCLTKKALLYTEMVTTGALLHGDHKRYLSFNKEEHPVALQLGGSDPKALAQCAAMAEDFLYDEINLNIGCPSDRVQNGRFGACLMAEPHVVADGVAAMKASTNLPVTVKCRIGIDDQEDFESLYHFIKTVSTAGCGTFIIHARKAWLKGLSPKENRDLPPLKYEVVYKIKEVFPNLEILINGGIKSLEEAQQHLVKVDGIMMGRAAYTNPYLLAKVDQTFYGSTTPPLSRHEVIENFMPYIKRELATGTPLKHMARHILGLFSGQPGAKQFRRYLSENMHHPDASLETLREALTFTRHQTPTEIAWHGFQPEDHSLPAQHARKHPQDLAG